jgi:DNA helicase II / ATP-dependent DNA helicase PcrA
MGAAAIPKITQLWKLADFTPNPKQREAILYGDGPLYLPAGPGSGKTRVLLWRVLNLLVFGGVSPEAIFLSTFTEKAALQLREGLRSLLSLVTEKTGRPYDLSKMYVGTVHSLCHRLLNDRRFSSARQRQRTPHLMDELAQYMFLRRKRNWEGLTQTAGIGSNANRIINEFFQTSSQSRHEAVSNCIRLFNRLSEECIDPKEAQRKVRDGTFRQLLKMYAEYQGILDPEEGIARVDFSLIQQKALQVLDAIPSSIHAFRYVILDEYQDTNTIQESLFFKLAEGHKNICVVGDDDQALYRFRGATVENFVEFPERCRERLGLKPHQIVLAQNYRSGKRIVTFCTTFMDHPTCDWRKKGRGQGSFRVEGKDITAHRQDDAPSVVASDPGQPQDVAKEIAELVRRLIDQKKVENANQVAFLFPSLGSVQVQRMREALQAVKLDVYAPRAGRFLEVEEATAMLGLFYQVFGAPERGNYNSRDYQQYYDWVDRAGKTAEQTMTRDKLLERFIRERAAEVKHAVEDYQRLQVLLERSHWTDETIYDPEAMRERLAATRGLSKKAQQSLRSPYFHGVAQRRQKEGRPYSLRYAVNRAVSLDWTVLDLFYQLCGFRHFRAMFDLAEQGKDKDEGPICNLSLTSQYLARFQEEYPPLITGEWLKEDRFLLVFNNFLYALFRRGESEYEDAEDPFPKGRIAFITIHQAKGLEFPVVILGNLRKDAKLQFLETLVKPLLDREGEPLDRMAQFDVMRMFYVALSRAKNLLVLAHFKGPGHRLNEPFKTLLDHTFPRIKDLDLATLPEAKVESDDLPRNYSYTGDFLLYKNCPRHYMIFRRYRFAASRSQPMFFGSLVHQTIEDLHQLLIARRSPP